MNKEQIGKLARKAERKIAALRRSWELGELAKEPPTEWLGEGTVKIITDAIRTAVEQQQAEHQAGKRLVADYSTHNQALRAQLATVLDRAREAMQKAFDLCHSGNRVDAMDVLNVALKGIGDDKA